MDVVRAYSHVKARRRVNVDLPMEDHQDETRGRPNKATYGARDAAQNGSWSTAR